MNDSWDVTQKKLLQWQQHDKTAWQLRRILSDSTFYRIIAMCAAKRATNRSAQMSWQQWWGFYLERLSEREAIRLLVDVWNIDIWEHLQQEAQAQSLEVILKTQQQAALHLAVDQSLQAFIDSVPPPDNKA